MRVRMPCIRCAALSLGNETEANEQAPQDRAPHAGAKERQCIALLVLKARQVYSGEAS